MAVAPHAFPFRLVDRPSPGRAVFRLSASSRLARETAWSPILTLEMLAQAAIDLEPDGEAHAGGLLAGVDALRFADALLERPLAAGDTLEATVARVGAFGRLLKLEGRLERDGEVVVEGAFLLAAG